MRSVLTNPIFLVVMLGLLNLFDLAVTVLLLDSGLAIEVNPLMAYAYSVGGSLLLGIVKVLLVGVGMVFLMCTRDHSFSRRALAIAVALYALLGVYQGYFLASSWKDLP